MVFTVPLRLVLHFWDIDKKMRLSRFYDGPLRSGPHNGIVNADHQHALDAHTSFAVKPKLHSISVCPDAA
jgi:hypothetical protein